MVKAIDKLNHGISREYSGASVETVIVPIYCGDIHVPGSDLNLALAQNMGHLSHLEKVKQSYKT